MKNTFLETFFIMAYAGETYENIFTFFLVLSLIYTHLLVKQSFKRIECLKNPEINNSYSLISEYMLKTMIASLVF